MTMSDEITTHLELPALGEPIGPARRRRLLAAAAPAAPALAGAVFARLLLWFQGCALLGLAARAAGRWGLLEVAAEEAARPDAFAAGLAAVAAGSAPTPGGCTAAVVVGPSGDVPAEVRLWLEIGDGVSLCWRDGVCTPDFLDAFVPEFTRLLSAGASGADLEPAPPGTDAFRALARWGTGPRRAYDGRPVTARIRARAMDDPGRAAVLHDGVALGYGELQDRADAWSARLRAAGASGRVGVLMRRTPEMFAVLLGVLGAGLSYVPLDPGYPAERIETMLDDSDAGVLVVGPGLIPPAGYTGVVVDAARQSEPAPAPPAGPTPTGEAYCIYTSGSTGRPKGVPIGHAALSNYVDGFADDVDLAGVERIVCVSTVCFDIFVTESWVALSHGLTVVLATEVEQADTGLLGELIQREQVGLVQSTPSRLGALFDDPTNADRLGSLRLVLSGGEAMTPRLAERVAAVTSARLVNLYGPTETTVWATTSPVVVGAPITIGTPMPNVLVCLVDARGVPTPPGGIGEIGIGGPGLSPGYHRRPELNESRFITRVLFPGGTPERLYLTGDLGRWSVTGDLLYLGRLDNQVKIRGYRIEIGEIEARIQALPGVRHVVVRAFDDANGDRYLCAFTDAGALTLDGLRAGLAGFLPEYMIPTRLRHVATFVMTGSGKIDRKALTPATGTAVSSVMEAVPARGADEEALLEVFREVFGTDEIGATHHFTELGGHSLLAMRVVALAKGRGIRLTVPEVLEAGTVQRLATGLSPTAPALPTRTDGTALPSGTQPVDSADLDGVWRGVLRQLRKFAAAVTHTPVTTRFPASAGQTIMLARDEYLQDGLVLDWAEPIDLDALERAVSGLVNRHVLLRSRLRGGTWETHAGAERYPMPFLDLSGLDAAGAARVRDLVEQKLFNSPYAPARDLSFRCLALRTAAADWSLYLPFAHLIFDGASEDVVRREVLQGYAAALRGEAGPGTGPGFDDYVAAVAAGLADADLAALAAELEPDRLLSAGGALAARFARLPAGRSYASHRIDLPAEHAADGFAIALGTFAEFCGREFGLADVPVSVMTYGRRVGDQRFFGVVGECMDTLPVVLPTDAARVAESTERIERVVRATEAAGINMFAVQALAAGGGDCPADLAAVLADLAGRPVVVFNFQGVADEGERARRDAILTRFADIAAVNLNFTCWQSETAVHVHAILPYEAQQERLADTLADAGRAAIAALGGVPAPA